MSDLLEGTAFPAVDPVGGPTVVLVIGGDALHPDAVAAVPDDAVIMAADSGLDHARSAGLTPTVLIGDLDSVSAEVSPGPRATRRSSVTRLTRTPPTPSWRCVTRLASIRRGSS